MKTKLKNSVLPRLRPEDRTDNGPASGTRGRTLPRIILFIGVIALTLLPLAFTGCNTTGAVNTQYNSAGQGTVGLGLSNENYTATGTFNPVTGEWTAGISIVFKDVPDAALIAALGKAGAVPAGTRSALTWNVPQYDRRNQDQIYAIRKSREVGAIIKPLRP